MLAFRAEIALATPMGVVTAIQLERADNIAAAFAQVWAQIEEELRLYVQHIHLTYHDDNP